MNASPELRAELAARATPRDPALVERLRAGSLRRGDSCKACGKCGSCGAFATPMGALTNGDDTALESLYGKSMQRGLDSSLAGMVGKPWRPPALKRDGAPFKPTAATVGTPVGSPIAWVEYVDGQAVTRRGQVWSGCSRSPGAVWVAPEDGGPAVALSKTLEVLR